MWKSNPRTIWILSDVHKPKIERKKIRGVGRKTIINVWGESEEKKGKIVRRRSRLDDGCDVERGIRFKESEREKNDKKDHKKEVKKGRMITNFI